MKRKLLKAISIQILQFAMLLMVPLYLSSCSSARSGEVNSLGLLALLNRSGTDATPTALADLSDLSINTIGAGSISLTWSDPAGSDLDHMEISVNPADIATVLVAKGAGSVTLNGLNTDKNYTYTIKAVDVSDNSSSGISVMAYMPVASTPVTFIAGDSDVNDLHTLLQDDVDSATGGYYILGKDIDLSEYADPWVPVGDEFTSFIGSLDGGSHTLNNMTIYILPVDTNYQGLFGSVGATGTVRNITMEDVNIILAGYYTGSVVGWNEGTVSDCVVSGQVQGGEHSGGLVGHNEGIVKSSRADVTMSGGHYLGGIVGYNTGTITGSHATGNINEDDLTLDSLGGLVGYNNGGTIEKSSATGNVNARKNGGGFVGTNFNGTISESFSTGSVSCSDMQCGGFASLNSGGTLKNSYSLGDVSGTSYAGGFVGINSLTIENCYSSGAVSGSASSGGFVSFSTVAVTSSYYNSTLAGQTDSKATDIDLAVQSNFAGWDFTNTWAIDGAINSGYPHLQWSE